MSEQPVNTVRLQSIAQAYGQSAALMAAVDLDLFSVVEGGASDIESIARGVGIHPINAERIVTMCTALGLLELSEGRYTNAPDVARFLVKGSRRYAGAWMLFRREDWGKWGELANHLRVTDLRVLADVADMTVDDARTYHDATKSIGMGAGRLFCRQVDLSDCRLLIDIGGGSGAYCIAAAQDNPELRALVLDLPPVAEVAREYIAEHGVSDRVSAQACDFTADPFPQNADVAVMASNLPMYNRDVIASVVAKAHDALNVGGSFHLIGETLDDDRKGPISAAYWGLGQALHHSHGLAHTQADCIGYLKAAGFAGVNVAEFVPGVLSRISGTRIA